MAISVLHWQCEAKNFVHVERKKGKFCLTVKFLKKNKQTNIKKSQQTVSSSQELLRGLKIFSLDID